MLKYAIKWVDTVAINNICYWSDEEWVPLPEWARFYINLGEAVASYNMNQGRLVLGLAIPTRAFAASLIAAGIVATLSRVPVTSLDENEYFNHFCTLETGTPLVYRCRNRVFQAVFDGVTEFEGEKRIRLRITNPRGGNLTALLNANQSMGVTKAKTKHKLPKSQGGRKILADDRFTRSLLPDGVDVYEFASSSRLECLIVGRVKSFYSEAIKTQFAAKSDNKFLVGNLQALLRIRKFSPRQPYRSDIYHLGQRNAAAPSTLPKFVLFDGSQAYLQCRHFLRQSPWIILLDRTDRSFHEAVHFVNDGYARRTGQGALQIPAFSSGIEGIVYEEAWI